MLVLCLNPPQIVAECFFLHVHPMSFPSDISAIILSYFLDDLAKKDEMELCDHNPLITQTALKYILGCGTLPSLKDFRIFFASIGKKLSYRMINAAKDGSLLLVEYFLTQGVTDYAIDGALRRASGKGHLPIVKLLDKRDHIVNQALYCACRRGRIEVVKYITNRIDIDINSALYIAAEYGHFQIVKFFLDTSPNPNDLIDGLDIAAKNGYSSIVKSLLDYKAIPSHVSVYNSCAMGHLPVLKLLLQHGAIFEYDSILLTQACLRGHAHVAKFLLGQGVKASIKINPSTIPRKRRQQITQLASQQQNWIITN